ncbi:vanillate O-demethylase oxidoreductase [Pseudomonas sp. CYM-20-01]|uniref:PDR/VanB family oxidoreductase n=1 Tax=Pseudomonas sp. CYM-20-01 TaxID=2870750 RepID=UPI00204C1247|nr:PDR/VanB family oxidoreductase [Pseudomonas sp. CYM-20-01]BDB20741.1 vanillate O-demethylase oxidoreductase [Pseudomonas sp. CYM-20-01]
MFEVIVVQKRHEAEGVCSFELCRGDGQPLPAFTAGAHIDVRVSVDITRQYSLCNSPLERDRYLIGVLHEAMSRGGSRGMHERIGVGDRLSISAPKNHFPLTTGARKSILLGGGIGITPVLAMAFQLAHEGAEFELHYCVRDPRRAAFLQLIAASGFADNLYMHFDTGERHQLLDLNHVLAEPRADTHLYVCGPNGFMDYVINTAHGLGWPIEQIHREYFAASSVVHDVDQAFEVELAESGLVLEVPTDKSVLDVLCASGIELPSSCRQGVCGACMTPVIEGVPDHRDVFMSDKEHALNDQFTPCCSRSKTRRLVLAL